MKVEKLSGESGFKPIELKIMIESRDELLSLWHKLNVTGAEIEESYAQDGESPDKPFPEEWEILYVFWNTIDDEVGK